MINEKNSINFRDLGGVRTKTGKKVREKRLLRAAQLVDLSEDELAMLKSHELKHIVDFRTTYETRNSPNDSIDGVSYTHIDIMADNPGAADPNKWMSMLNLDTVGEDMRRTYRDFVTSPSAKKGYGKYVKTCIDVTDGAVLFHCAAGKDRTGVGAAIILKLLGVADEDIYADYLMSKEGRKEANESQMQELRAKGLPEDKLAAMQILCNVQDEWLDAAFEAITDEHGCFYNFATQGLGISADDILRLAELYLE